MWSPRRTTLALAGAALLTLSACGGDASTGDGSAEVASTEAVTAESVAPQEPSDAGATEAVFVPLADGGQLDFNSLRGQDVVLWFWAPW